jgi:hypothetical protein
MTAILQASVPRSGNHLLLKLLWDAMPDGYISTCEFYTAPNCCKRIPCNKINSEFLCRPAESSNQGKSHLFVHKTHDFELSDLPTSQYATLFQLRNPHEYLLSHLIWELSQMAYFGIGSAMAFAHKSAIYYIRMYIKWAVLYSDLLLVPPIFYESLLTRSGKSAALLGISEAIGFGITNEQLNYSIDKSTLHSHSGASFTSSVTRQASTLIDNSFVIRQCTLFANSILQFLPTLCSVYSPQICKEPVEPQQLLPLYEACLIPEDESTSVATVQLTGGIKIKDGHLSGRKLYLEGTGIGPAHPDGSFMIGCVTLLPIKLQQKAPISIIEVTIVSPDARSSENAALMKNGATDIALIYLDQIVGWFKAAVDPNILRCKVDLTQPIIPYSETILLALGVRPRSDLASICDRSRDFRFVSEIVIRFNHG